jgi:hypothetical protein
METLELSKCKLCGKTGEDLTLLGVRHKELGWIEVCGDCWKNSYDENSLVAGTGGKSGGCSGCCGGCKSC